MDATPPTSLVLAVGSVFILTFYGFRQLRREQAGETGVRQIDREPAGLETALAGEFRDSSDDGEWPAAGGSVLCRDCGMEYPAGVLYCDCGSELVDAEDAEDMIATLPERRVLEESALVCVHTVSDRWRADLLRAFLDSRGIPSMLRGNVASGYAHFPVPDQHVKILVAPEDVEQARELIASLN